MKRILAVAVAVLLVLSLAGCGLQGETPAGQDPQQTGQDSQSSGQPDTQTNSQPGSQSSGQPAVQTDWSKLTPYQPAQPVYTYHAGYKPGGALEARDDYGILLPYIGKRPVSNYIVGSLPMYGLVTDTGQLVSDPLYADISFLDDFLLLKQGDPAALAGDETSYDAYTYTLAAADGRWVHALADSYYAGSGDGRVLTATKDGSLSLWNTDGEVVGHFDSKLFRPWFGKKDFRWRAEGGPFLSCVNGVGHISYWHGEGFHDLYLDLTAGTVTETPPEGYPSETEAESGSEDTPKPPFVVWRTYSGPVEDEITGEIYFPGEYRNSQDGPTHYALFGLDGTLLVENAFQRPLEWRLFVRGGLCSTLENGCFCYRAIADNRLVFRYVLQTNVD